MNPIAIIEKYYNPSSDLYEILVNHSRSVADKALSIANLHPEMNIDRHFVEEAAMLHDIGIFYCDAPEIGCVGTEPYIRHGILGAELMRKEGFPQHALVCERHSGTGLYRETIKERTLPLPAKDYCPVSLEEQLICFADKFFSKTNL
ncbi:MAG: HDIG domain-containing protein, partial [Tannerella sp.]|nr:HDIG domain-containing protein [Tannerella sp.]